MDLRGLCAMVVGLGASGRAAARFLASRGASLVLTDTRRDLSTADLPLAQLHLGGEEAAWLGGVDLVVVSPGVPLTSKLVAAARRAGTPVIGELELASRFIKFPLIAVTGTNGKSTVTTLISKICQNAGMKTFVGGNLGTPLVEAISHEFDLAVVEVSSYQLETIASFKPQVAIHLNLSDDHFDRYHNLAAYGRAKARIFENQDPSDWAILNREDPLVWKLRDEVKAKVLSLGRIRPSFPGAAEMWEESGLRFAIGGNYGTISLNQFRLPGRFNHSNAMAAAGAALLLNVAPRVIERTFAEFDGLPHRLQPVCQRNGVSFIDDSKGTNVGAVLEALAAVRAPIVLIAGGVGKGGSYDALRAPIREKVRLLILYGDARRMMRSDLDGTTRIELVQTMQEGVARATAEARAGDTVLLSPACASFDQFENYAARGRAFQKLVCAL